MSSTPSPRDGLINIISITFLLLSFCGISWISLDPARQDVYWFLGLIAISSLSLAVTYHFSKSISKKTVLLFAIAVHIIGLFGQPLFEDDHYRYLWDGYRFIESGTPYGIAPDQFYADTSVPEKMQRVLDGVNNPSVPTIYGPVLQYFFAIGYWIAPAEFLLIRIFLCLVNLSLVALLLRKADAANVLLYAINPLVFKEIALTGHPDIILAMMLYLAWLFQDRYKPYLSGFFFGLALATKISALPTMAWLLWQRRIVAIPIAALILVLTYLPFAGASNDTSGLLVFANQWQFNAGPYAWFANGFGDRSARIICLLITVVIMFWIQYKVRNNDAFPPWHRVFGCLLLFSPVINAWYLLWLLPFSVFYRDVWPWFAAAALMLSYATGVNLDLETIEAFTVISWAATVQWLLIAIGISIDLWRHLIKAKSSTQEI